MPEPEELFVDAARHATATLQDLWQRYREAKRTPGPLLADQRQRLELLVEAVLGRPWPIRPAQAAAPVPLLRRWLRPERATAATEAVLPGSDGTAIYLPPELPPAASDAFPDDYALLALLQGLRCERGSAAGMPRDDALVADFYLLAEAAAAEHELLQRLPGWGRALAGLKARIRDLAAARPRPASGAATRVARRHAIWLAGEGDAVPTSATPAGSLAWARQEARQLRKQHSHGPHRPLLADLLVGRLFPPEAGATCAFPAAGVDATHQAGSGKRAALTRRPRARAGKEDEDDATPGLWMVQTAEPLEHAEDPLGLNRPADQEAEGDLPGGADSLAEMDEARLVRTPGRAHETFYGADPPVRGEDAPPPAEAAGFAYPEWEHVRRIYLEAAVHVQLRQGTEGDPGWAGTVLERHGGLLAEIRRRLGALRPERQVLRRQPEGDDIDGDALVAERTDRRAGLSPPGAIYTARRPAPRRLALLLLIDASGSTDSWIGGGARVIDVEKEAALVAAEALAAARAQFAMLAFSGEGPHGVMLARIKPFDAPWDAGAMRRLGGLEPDRYTRLGGAVRHAAALLAGQPADHRLLLLFSDGRPNDCDRYSGRHGLEDARQALIEARMQRLAPYCFTVDRESGAYLPTLFGVGRYTIVQRPQQLPLAFIGWLRRAAHDCLG